jgi:hypothetical protein
MVRKYLQHIEALIGRPGQFHDEINGMYADGWTGGNLYITHAAGSCARTLELVLEAPGWAPYKNATVTLDAPAGKKRQWTIGRGKSYEIRVPLTETESRLVFSIEPAFVPASSNMGADDRTLGVRCKTCHIISADKDRIPLWPATE